MSDLIQIKRSFSDDHPGNTLLPGELAYSYVSGQLYIGNSVKGQAAIAVTNQSVVPVVKADTIIHIDIE